jgi:hypothetical protein
MRICLLWLLLSAAFAHAQEIKSGMKITELVKLKGPPKSSIVDGKYVFQNWPDVSVKSYLDTVLWIRGGESINTLDGLTAVVDEVSFYINRMPQVISEGNSNARSDNSGVITLLIENGSARKREAKISASLNIKTSYLIKIEDKTRQSFRVSKIPANFSIRCININGEMWDGALQAGEIKRLEVRLLGGPYFKASDAVQTIIVLSISSNQSATLITEFQNIGEVF